MVFEPLPKYKLKFTGIWVEKIHLMFNLLGIRGRLPVNQFLVELQSILIIEVPASNELDQLQISLWTKSLMLFMNCSVFCDVQHVQSLVLGQNVIFGSVRILVLLLCDQTSLGTYSLMFANCSFFCDVRHVRSSILGQNVQIFNVWSVRSSVFWCSFQDHFLGCTSEQNYLTQE